MAKALSNISNTLRDIKRIVKSWGDENGYGIIFTCSKCRKQYVGKLSKCPHCGDEKDY